MLILMQHIQQSKGMNIIDNLIYFSDYDLEMYYEYKIEMCNLIIDEVKYKIHSADANGIYVYKMVKNDI